MCLMFTVDTCFSEHVYPDHHHHLFDPAGPVGGLGHRYLLAMLAASQTSTSRTTVTELLSAD